MIINVKLSDNFFTPIAEIGNPLMPNDWHKVVKIDAVIFKSGASDSYKGLFLTRRIGGSPSLSGIDITHSNNMKLGYKLISNTSDGKNNIVLYAKGTGRACIEIVCEPGIVRHCINAPDEDTVNLFISN